MSHQAFVSYAKNDEVIVRKICAELEENEIFCWYAPRNVPPGADWDASIMEALTTSNVMILVWSTHSDQSKQVKREVALALDEVGVTVIPYHIEPIEPSRLRYYLNGIQWLDASILPPEVTLKRLIEQVRVAIPICGQLIASPEEQIRHAREERTESLLVTPASEEQHSSTEGTSEETRLLNEIEALQEDEAEVLQEAEAEGYRYAHARKRLLAEVEALKMAEIDTLKRLHEEDTQYAETRARLLADVEALRRQWSLKRAEAERARKREEVVDAAMKKAL